MALRLVAFYILLISAFGRGQSDQPVFNIGDRLAARLDAEAPALLDKYSEPGLAVVYVEGCHAT